eukprot:3906462-Rhodomonas_salina.1
MPCPTLTSPPPLKKAALGAQLPPPPPPPTVRPPPPSPPPPHPRPAAPSPRRNCTCCAMSGTGLAHGAMPCPVQTSCDETCGTDPGYHDRAVRCPVLRSVKGTESGA